MSGGFSRTHTPLTRLLAIRSTLDSTVRVIRLRINDDTHTLDVCL